MGDNIAHSETGLLTNRNDLNGFHKKLTFFDVVKSLNPFIKARKGMKPTLIIPLGIASNIISNQNCISQDLATIQKNWNYKIIKGLRAVEKI